MISSVPWRFVCLVSMAAALSVQTAGGVPLYSDEPSGEFMREWLVCGPFANAPDSAGQLGDRHHPPFEAENVTGAAGEQPPAAEAGATVHYGEAEGVWTLYASPTNEIDLDEALSSGDGLLGYAYCEIEAPAACPCILSLGSNDGCRVWLNGREVWDYPKGRPLRPDEDVVPVILRKGRNELLLKIENRGRAWGFLCRLIPLDDGEGLTGRFQLFQLDLTGAQPVVRLRFPALVTDGLLDHADLTVRSVGDRDSAVWAGSLRDTDEIVLPISSKSFTRYVLDIEAILSDGSAYTDTSEFALGQREVHALFQHGASDYEIVVGADASESEQWAAQELSHWLAEASGALFHIRTTQGRRRFPHSIVIGYNEASKALLPDDYEPPRDDDESFFYWNAGEDIVILGGRDRGSMYGVFTFLERELGCRWYAPEVSVIPKRDEYTFTYLRHREKPGLRMREVCYFDALDPVWRARNKVNAGGTVPQVGGQYLYWNVHTFAKLMPPAEYFDEYPEYYSLNDGVRVADKDHPHNGAQLCLSNPEVLRIITEKIRQVMREHPEYLVYSVSQNDGEEYGPCECDACRAIRERFGGEESGVIIWFVNQVADAIRDEFPGKFIGTLAYTYSECPPTGIRPRDNVVVRLCNFYGDMAHPLDSPENGHPEFAEAVVGWSRVAPHLYIWDYVMSFSHFCLPFPNLLAMPEHLRFYRDHGAFGYYPQALAHGRGAEFARLRAYLLAKLMWNPDLDASDTMDDFVCGYYGRSGRFIREYIDLLHALVTPETHIQLWLKPHHPPFTEAFIEEAEAIFDEAERVADDPVIFRRVELARLPVMYLKCYRMPEAAKHDGTYARVAAVFERESIRYLSEQPESSLEAFQKMMNEAP